MSFLGTSLSVVYTQFYPDLSSSHEDRKRIYVLPSHHFAWFRIPSLGQTFFLSDCLSLLRAAIMKSHRPSALPNPSSFSCRSRGWKSKIKVLEGFISPEAALLGIQRAVFSCTAFTLLSGLPLSLSLVIPSSYKDTSQGALIHSNTCL